MLFGCNSVMINNANSTYQPQSFRITTILDLSLYISYHIPGYFRISLRYFCGLSSAKCSRVASCASPEQLELFDRLLCEKGFFHFPWPWSGAENRGTRELGNPRTGETRREKRRSERCSSRCGTVISVLLVK